MKTRLTTKEAAEYLEVSAASLEKSRCGYHLLGVEPPPFLKIGRNIRYNRSTLDAWISQFEEQKSTEGAA